MNRPDPTTLAQAVSLPGWPRITHPAGITEAWRQMHFAAQVAAELGKGWAEYQDDDSHSAFSWYESDDGRGLRGAPTSPTPTHRDPAYAFLKFEGMQVSVEAEDGRTLFDLTLEGRTVTECLEWLHQHATDRLGPPAQSPRPAPDLPDHGLNWLRGNTGTFVASPPANNDLADLYAATDAMLRRLAEALGQPDAEPSCWPHHFDHAALFTAASSTEGPTKTIGVGITPPDSLDPAGYWYVSPWAKESTGDDHRWPELRAGRWIDGHAGLRMAVLPLDDVFNLDIPAQGHAVAAFLAVAVAGCLEVLTEE